MSNPILESDDGSCTDCDDIGITSQTERFCSCNNGLAASKEDAIQARIDAAVLAERKAIIAGMQEEISRCKDGIERGSLVTEHKASIFQLKCEIEKIRARPTNNETAPPPDAKGADYRVELLRQRVTILEYALLDVAKQARPLREWGGNVGQVMIAARKNGWEGTGKLPSRKSASASTQP
jgi:hypothetical protein